ncbi:hypothetical protein FHX16_006366 [Rhizobium sp. BK661]|nr:hypothetical protein [Rhizobium sp. BK661]
MTEKLHSNAAGKLFLILSLRRIGVVTFLGRKPPTPTS